MQGQHDNRRADANVLRAAGDRAEEGPDSREQAVAGEAVLAKPYLVEAGFVGELYLLLKPSVRACCWVKSSW